MVVYTSGQSSQAFNLVPIRSSRVRIPSPLQKMEDWLSGNGTSLLKKGFPCGNTGSSPVSSAKARKGKPTGGGHSLENCSELMTRVGSTPTLSATNLGVKLNGLSIGLQNQGLQVQILSPLQQTDKRSMDIENEALDRRKCLSDGSRCPFGADVAQRRPSE